MPVKITGSSSGFVNLDAKSAAASNTLTLPDTANGELVAADSSGNINLADSKRLKFGAGDDLNLYSTGTNGWVYTPQSGADLYMGTNAGEVYIQTGSSANDTAIKVNSDAAVELYYDNAKKFETQSAGCEFTGILKNENDGEAHRITLGAANDFNFYHDGTNSIIKNNTNTLVVRSDLFKVTNNADTETLLSASANGSVALYYDNTKKFETTSSASTFSNSPVLINHSDGISVYGSIAMLETSTYGWIRSYNSKGVYVRPTTNGAYIDSGATSWTSGSDERTKTGLTPITDALTKIKGCRSVIGRYKTDEESKKRSFLIAQDFQTHFPEAVSVDTEKESDENLGLRYQDVIPLLLAGIKELSAEVETLKTKVAVLEGS